MKKTELNALFAEYLETRSDISFKKLENEVSPWLLTKIKFYIKDEDDAWDLVQETWVTALTIGERYDPSMDFKVWIFYKIARGKILHFLRDRCGKTVTMSSIALKGEDGEEIDYADSLDSGEQTPVDIIEGKEKTRKIRKILKRLRDNYQDVFILKNYARLPLYDIAEMMNANYATVRIWHHNAKNELENLSKKYSIN